MNGRSILTGLGIVGAAVLMFNRGLRAELGVAAGWVLAPVLGFHGQYPHLTIMLLGAIVALATTLVRHATTDWLDHARKQRTLRAWQSQVRAAKKDGDGNRMAALDAHKDRVLALQREFSSHQMRTMPLTLLVVVPTFAWLAAFVGGLDAPYYAAPWNPHVNLLGSTVLPHWVLLYMCISIPLGTLASAGLKALSWRRLGTPSRQARKSMEDA